MFTFYIIPVQPFFIPLLNSSGVDMDLDKVLLLTLSKKTFTFLIV